MEITEKSTAALIVLLLCVIKYTHQRCEVNYSYLPITTYRRYSMGYVAEQTKVKEVTCTNLSDSDRLIGISYNYEKINQVQLLNSNITASKLSSFFSNVPFVERINIQRSELNVLSKYRFPYKGLKRLELPANNISQIPELFLSNIPTLQDFNISNNNIRNITWKMLDSNSLLTLNLSYNQISTLLNTAFNSTPKLNELFLKGNRLKSLPIDVFKYIPLLKVLDLSSNSLESLEIGVFSKQQQLSKLYLQENKLKILSNIFHFSPITVLNISNNQLDHFNYRMMFAGQSFNLEWISLSGNNWTCDTLSEIIRWLHFSSSRDNLKIDEGNQHSVSNINGIACKVNTTAEANLTLPEFLKENIEILKNLKEFLNDAETVNEDVIHFIRNSSAASFYNTDILKNLSEVVQNLTKILTSEKDTSRSLKQESQPHDLDIRKDYGSSSTIVALLCVQVIFLIIIITIVIYPKLKYKIGKNRDGIIELRHSNEHDELI